MTVHRCPDCGSSEELWQALTVSGWQAISEQGIRGRRDVDWDEVKRLSEGGCAGCGWRGAVEQMRVTLGVDGEPLPEVHPGQMEIAS